jgi:fructan beta-fructosidase
MKFPYLVLVIFITLSASAKKPEKVYNESYRPQFHFTPENNKLSYPNGLVSYNGEYHLFYQYSKYGNDSTQQHLGHAVSNDLLHWEQLSFELTPLINSVDKTECTELFGSGIIDENNATGLQSGNEKTMLLFYTSLNCGQKMAYSNDKGRTWKNYDKNPIIAFNETDNATDPKVFWHEASKHFVMVLFRKPDNDGKKKGFSIYTSKNMINWEYKDHIPGFSERPDMVELPTNRREDDKKWVLFDGNGSYLIGTFNGEKFVPESPKLSGDFGSEYYAPQTWNNIPETDGRTIQIAGMNGSQIPEMPFMGQMNFPCELSLKKFTEGIRLMRKPIKEIELLHQKGEVWENKNLIPGINKNLIRSVKNDCLHIIGSFKIKTADNFGFFLRLDKENNGTEIIYNVKTKRLTCLGKSVTIEPVDGTIKLEILLDRSSIEIFANDGKEVLSSCFVPIDNAYGLYLFNIGGELLVQKLEIYPIMSIWEKEK